MKHDEPRLILAVDGGGTKTRCWAAVESPSQSHAVPEFSIIGRGRSGPSNPRSVGFDVACNNIEFAIQEAIQQSDAFRSSAKGSSIAVACISLAGAGRPEEQNRIRDRAEQRQWAQHVIVVDDVQPLRLAAEYEYRHLSTTLPPANSCQWTRSITLVVGTGAIAIGCDERDKTARSDGWGYLLGDEGSGFSIGLAGLRSICETHDQGLELSEFHQALMQHLNLKEPTQLIGWTYQDTLPRPSIAELASIVLRFADSDPIAYALAIAAVDAMVKKIANVATRLGFSDSEYALALSGGVLNHHPWLIEHLLLKLVKKEISPEVTHRILEPLYGPTVIAAQK